MNKNLKLILAMAAATTFAASAHNTPNALVDSSGKAVMGGFDQCIEVTTNPASADCGAEMPAKILETGFSLAAKALFDTNKSMLRPAGKAQLDELASRIKQGRELGKIKRVTAIDVVGHTDSRGTNAYNQSLSERRANSVRSYLAQKGVSSSIINAYGEGESSPVATNDTAAGRQQNRRVDVTVKGTGAK